jgi:hypothetical protein
VRFVPAPSSGAESTGYCNLAAAVVIWLSAFAPIYCVGRSRIQNAELGARCARNGHLLKIATVLDAHKTGMIAPWLARYSIPSDLSPQQDHQRFLKCDPLRGHGVAVRRAISAASGSHYAHSMQAEIAA